jgi:hypothetical protein
VRLSSQLLWIGASGVLALGSCRPRPSQIPLGGVHEIEAPARRPAIGALPAAAPGSPSLETATEEPEVAGAEEVQVTAAAPLAAGTSDGGEAVASASFRVEPYTARQAWTRLVDIDVAIKVGPAGNVDMKMTTHQEARFEVLSVGAAGIEKLGIEYTTYTTKLSFMGTNQDSPEELSGKRFVVTFNQGKPDVRDASGAQPPKKQVDSVKDDAREPLETEKALKELSSLTVKGRGDFTTAGAISLAGGEDEDTKVTGARGSLQRLLTSTSGQKSAVIDLAYTLTSELDERSTLEARVSGTVSVVDAPSRYQASTLQGPMELRSSEPGGMAGRGTIKVSTTYRY